MADIISIGIALFSLFVSIYSARRSDVVRQQDMQEPLYADMQQLLKYQCNYFSAEQEVLECDVAVPRIGRDEENAIIRRVRRCFGIKNYKQLCEILGLCKKANSINSDMKILFNLIREEDSNEYLEVKKALEVQQQDISQDEYETVQKFLATITIPFYQLTENEPGKSYDYLTLNHELLLLDKQIREKKKILDQELQKIMKKR